MANLEIDTIQQFAPLFKEEHPEYHSRYKVFYGGRGGRKSWEVARSLILKASQSKKLVLCTREIQNSISDSVLRLLESQIELLGLNWFFEVQRSTIIGRNGSEFIFKGLNNMTIDSIKSLEGADICWVEEAHSVSDRSWSILIPTIRKQGSEINITFNPDLEDDPVYTRFIKNTPASCYLSRVSYLDNPDCPNTIIEEANYLREVDYEAYAHVYLGEVRSHSDAQVFKNKYRVNSFEVDQSFGDPLFGADWGFSVDPTTVVKLYIKDNRLYIRHEAYRVQCEVDDTPLLFDKLPDVRRYTVRADNARPELISYMQRNGFSVIEADKWPGCPEDRVAFMRSFKEIIVHPDCKHTAEEMRLYSYKTDKRTGDVLPQLEKRHDHCIDAIGYAITPLIRHNKKVEVI